MMPDGRYQHIADVSAQQGSQAVVGTVGGNVYFANHRDAQQTSEQEAKACRDSLFLSDPCVDRQELISAKGFIAEGTCVWIRDNKSYQAWKNGDISLLWITGGPGQGKTMLSIFLTEELEQEAISTGTTQVVYYFSIHKKRDTGVGLLRGLIFQILSKRPGLAKHALPHLETTSRAQQTLSSLESLWIIFQKLIADPDLGAMFCVLDGLDECDEATLEVLLPRLFHQLGPRKSDSSSQTMFRVVVVSRDIDGLQGCTKVNLGIGDDARGPHDIERFIHAKVEELFTKKGFDNSIRPAVQQVLLERAGGTFLWVGFVVQELRRLRTCTQLLPMLDSLPGDLGSMYGRMLLQILPEHRKISSLILRWVSFAQRPLKLRELAAAVNLKPVSDLISLKQTALDAITLCGPILDVKGKQVTLVHQSARDYLLREKSCRDQVLEQFRFGSKRSHRMLARKCYECIAQSHFRDERINLRKRLLSKDSPFLQYAASHWIQHVRGCSDTASRLFKGSYPFFGDGSDLRANWWQAYNRLTFGYGEDYTTPVLHMMSYLGVPSWVETLLAEGKELDIHDFVNTKDGLGRTPLHWAARGSNSKVVQMLLDHGVDLDARDSDLCTATDLAVFNGDIAVVKQILDQGADVRGSGWEYYTLLHNAVEIKNEAMVKLLVEKGVEIDAKNGNGDTALAMAVCEEFEALVQLLLELGADVNAQSGDPVSRSVLHQAVHQGNKEIVELLLNNGADLESRKWDGITPLHASVRSEDEAMVELLIDKGADIYSKDDLDVTILLDVAMSGSGELVQLFLGMDLEAMLKDQSGEKTLHAAVRSRKEVWQLFSRVGLVHSAVKRAAFQASSEAARNKLSRSLLKRWCGTSRR